MQALRVTVTLRGQRTFIGLRRFVIAQLPFQHCNIRFGGASSPRARRAATRVRSVAGSADVVEQDERRYAVAGGQFAEGLPVHALQKVASTSTAWPMVSSSSLRLYRR